MLKLKLHIQCAEVNSVHLLSQIVMQGYKKLQDFNAAMVAFIKS